MAVAALSFVGMGAITATAPVSSDRAIVYAAPASRPQRRHAPRGWQNAQYRFRSRWPATKAKRHCNRAHISRRVRRKHRRRA